MDDLDGWHRRWLDRYSLDDLVEFEKRAKDTRASAALRGYGHRWRKERAAFLADHTTCPCGAKATHVDHGRRVRDTAQTGFWDRRAWTAMCQPCHNAKSGRQTHEGKPGHRVLSARTRHTPK